jgi:hypothetical protein
MHIASGLAVARREPTQADVPMSREGSIPIARHPAETAAVRWRKAMPGAILLTILVVLGGLFPIIF